LSDGAVANVRLREAGEADARRLYELRNDPFVISHSTSRRAVPWPEHAAWFSRCLADRDAHRIYLIEKLDGGRPDLIGVVRFDRSDGTDAAHISAYLLERAIGRGIGSHAIDVASHAVLDEWDVGAIEALVVAGNERSRAAFRKAGYVEAGATEHNQRHWRLERSRSRTA
jgi:RimJ/RimL family protein N-acetyltransferase